MFLAVVRSTTGCIPELKIPRTISATMSMTIAVTMITREVAIAFMINLWSCSLKNAPLHRPEILLIRDAN
jgi:hypothetical protein